MESFQRSTSPWGLRVLYGLLGGPRAWSFLMFLGASSSFRPLDLISAGGLGCPGGPWVSWWVLGGLGGGTTAFVYETLRKRHSFFTLTDFA